MKKQVCDYATPEKYAMDNWIMTSFHNAHQYTAGHYLSDKRYFKQLAASADTKNNFRRNILNNSCSYT